MNILTILILISVIGISCGGPDTISFPEDRQENPEKNDELPADQSENEETTNTPEDKKDESSGYDPESYEQFCQTFPDICTGESFCNNNPEACSTPEFCEERPELCRR